MRASIGIICREHRFLAIHRNDGRGFSLPGGIAGWREGEESTLRREVHEETGLRVTNLALETRYQSTADVPCTISVFTVEADGELRESWEGTPQWLSLGELEPKLIKSQKPALELMRKIDAADQEILS
ncbi:MAG: NUDIX domain-containing protein [Candidatus Sulfotelmatobacter sp.]